MVFPYCRKCKGHKMLCGLNFCPIIENVKGKLKNVEVKLGDFSSITPPNVFVGEYNYPKVYAGPMMVNDLSSPYAIGSEFGRTMEDVISLNSNLYRASQAVSVKDVMGSFSLKVQESAMSIKTLDVEIQAIKKISEPKRNNTFFDTPVGPIVEVSRVDITDNPKIPFRIDNIYNDNHLKSTEAIKIMYGNNFQVNYIQGILSSGAIGIQGNRRMVPTRWSITAVDDTISKFLKEKILDCDILSDILVFSYSYNGNYFDIILLPYPQSFEMQEVWERGSLWNSGDSVGMDYESIEGRKTYADEVGGAYYAARLAVYEYLSKIRRQASIIVLRRISGEYYSPLGVWVIRETVRNAMNTPPMKFGSLEELLKYGKFEVPKWASYSRVLNYIHTQKRLLDYF